MIFASDWKVCFEIGLNHLGDQKNIEKVINLIEKQEIQCAVTVQIREENFYDGDNKQLLLNREIYSALSHRCSRLGIPLGLALGPVEDLTWILKEKLEISFLKFIYKSTNNLSFIKNANAAFDCPKYYSVGLSSKDYIKEHLLPQMKPQDMILQTVLSHDNSDQNLPELRHLRSLGKEVCFGLHSINPEITFAAIGAGAKQVFAYIGDKSLLLPDHQHAIDLEDAQNFYNMCMNCFSAMHPPKSNKKTSKIQFLG